jgi:hypothetical protein
MSHPNIPKHWSSEQLLAVYELLDSLLRQVFEQYDPPLGKLFAKQFHAELYRPPENQYDLFDEPVDPNNPDDIPF